MGIVTEAVRKQYMTVEISPQEFMRIIAIPETLASFSLDEITEMRMTLVREELNRKEDKIHE